MEVFKQYATSNMNIPCYTPNNLQRIRIPSPLTPFQPVWDLVMEVPS